MATTQLTPAVTGPEAHAVFTPLLQSLNSVLAQFQKGALTASVPYTSVSCLGEEGLASWKNVIEQSSNANIELRVSLATNAITVVPISSMFETAQELHPASTGSSLNGDGGGATPTSDGTTSSASSAGKKVTKGRDKKKAPRPKNAFIIYRKEWHPKMMALHPNTHNNDISVIIGQQWRNESEEVKRHFQDLAAEEKRQHLIDNPDYTYQPRKPSEKKKRMTKNKLAKLRAQGTSAEPDLTGEIDRVLAAAAVDNQVMLDSFQAPYRQGFPVVTDFNDHLSGFIAGSDNDDMLYNQLTAWNADHAMAQTTGSMLPGPAAMGHIAIDGQPIQHTPHFAVPVPFLSASELFSPTPAVTAGPQPIESPSASNTNAKTSMSEADRQEVIFDDALIGDLFDIDAFDVEAH